MKTKYLDEDILELKKSSKIIGFTTYGKEKLIEFKAIKKALNIQNVSNRLDESCPHCKENLYTELVPICKTDNCRYNDY